MVSVHRFLGSFQHFLLKIQRGEQSHSIRSNVALSPLGLSSVLCLTPIKHSEMSDKPFARNMQEKKKVVTSQQEGKKPATVTPSSSTTTTATTKD